MVKRKDYILLSLEESKKVLPAAMKVLKDELEGKESDKEKIKAAKKAIDIHLKHVKLLENEQRITKLELQVNQASRKK